MMSDSGKLVISVMLAVEDTPTALNWYKSALGAVELWNLGSVVGLEIEGAPFFLGQHHAPPGGLALEDNILQRHQLLAHKARDQILEHTVLIAESEIHQSSMTVPWTGLQANTKTSRRK